MIPKSRDGRVGENVTFFTSLGGCSGGLDRRRKGKVRLGSVKAQYDVGLEDWQREGEKVAGLRSVYLKSSLVGREEGWKMRVGLSKSGLGINGPFKASVILVVDCEARA